MRDDNTCHTRRASMNHTIQLRIQLYTYMNECPPFDIQAIRYVRLADSHHHSEAREVHRELAEEGREQRHRENARGGALLAQAREGL